MSSSLAHTPKRIAGKLRKICGRKSEQIDWSMRNIWIRQLVYIAISAAITSIITSLQNPFYEDGREIYKNMMKNNRPTLYEAYHNKDRCTPSMPCLYNLETAYMDGGAFMFLLYNGNGHMKTFGNMTKLNGYSFWFNTNITRVDYSHQDPYIVIHDSPPKILKQIMRCDFELERISYYNPSPLDCINFMNAVMSVMSRMPKVFPEWEPMTIKIYRLSEYYRHAIIYRDNTGKLLVGTMSNNLENALEMHMDRVTFVVDVAGFAYISSLVTLVIMVLSEVIYCVYRYITSIKNTNAR
jgi:hypothetical protein